MVNFRPMTDVAKASSILIIPRALYRGVILYFCWLWFLVPWGLPYLPYWTATIIGGVVSTLTFEHIGETHNSTSAFIKMMEWFFGINVFFLFAFIVHLFLHGV